MNNYQFELNKWYAVWKLTSNFNTYPTHLSVYFPTVKAQKQLSDEYISLGGLSTAIPVEFDSLLGTAYQFSDFVLEVVNNFSDVVEASWKWNGNRWESVVSSSIISATLTNASGAWTTQFQSLDLFSLLVLLLLDLQVIGMLDCMPIRLVITSKWMLEWDWKMTLENSICIEECLELIPI